jgi:hypothetical protein
LTNAISWPSAPAAAVFHGAAGVFVLRTEPHTESDRRWRCSHSCSSRSAVGRSAHYAVEASRHHTNEFVRARRSVGQGGPQGISFGPRRSAAARRRRGLHRKVPRVRDELRREAHRRGRGPGRRRAADQQQAQAHHRGGVRAFAQVLKVLAREGNTLSPVIRARGETARHDALLLLARRRSAVRLRAPVPRAGSVG